MLHIPALLALTSGTSAPYNLGNAEAFCQKLASRWDTFKKWLEQDGFSGSPEPSWPGGVRAVLFCHLRDWKREHEVRL